MWSCDPTFKLQRSTFALRNVDENSAAVCLLMIHGQIFDFSLRELCFLIKTSCEYSIFITYTPRDIEDPTSKEVLSLISNLNVLNPDPAANGMCGIGPHVSPVKVINFERYFGERL